MDNMLREVLDTDHRESERTAQLIKTREMIFDELREKKEELLSAAREQARDDIAELDKRYAGITRGLIDELLGRGREALRKLDEYGNAHRDEWADELVKAVLD
ncbi:MAG: hypothetical protein LBQ80_02325 [Clostridium sp.]|nr:hypothetical protein [Clostridium sp.]